MRSAISFPRPILPEKGKKLYTDYFESDMIDLINLHTSSIRLGGRGLDGQINQWDYLATNIQAADYVRKLANRMPGGFFIYRATGNEDILYANKSMLKIFNCQTMEEFREITGNSFRGLVHPEDIEGVERSIREQIAGNDDDMDYVEYRIIQKGGEIRWLEDYGHFTQHDNEGDIFYVFVVDATERKKRQLQEKEEQLQEQLRRLSMIAGLSIDYESIFYADLDLNRIQAYQISYRFQHKFQDINTVCPFIGFDSEYIQMWVHPSDRNILLKATDAAYIRRKLSKNKTFHVNYRIVQNGKEEYLQLRVVNIGNDNHVSQIVMGYRSVDDEIKYELEQKKMLKDALEQAKSSNIAKNTFLSNMSHDIRTPMNAIVGFAALAKKHIDEKGKVQEYLNMIETSSDQLLRLINDVLEISSIEADRIQIEESECSLLDIIQEIQSAIMPRVSAKNIDLSLNISGLKHYIVFSDRQKLFQILLRLTRNAVKYTEFKGQVSITVKETESTDREYASYQFIVQDNGIGISESFIQHIFEPFERQQNTTLSGIYGTGLGLTITKNIVDMMGGTIEVVSASGQGSTFTISLSLRIQNRQFQPFSPKNQKQKPASEHRRILLVEDNEINLEIEVELLQDAGFLVETATDGSIAIEKITHSEPGYYNLVLMDIQMPVMDGYHATSAIRRLENPLLANIPIVALSANTLDEDRRKAMECGMNAHLPKPVNMPQLMELVEKILAAF